MCLIWIVQQGTLTTTAHGAESVVDLELDM